MSKRKEKMIELVKIEQSIQEIYKRLMELEYTEKKETEDYQESLELFMDLKELETRKMTEIDIPYISKTLELFQKDTLQYIIREIANEDSFSQAEEIENNGIYQRICSIISEKEYKEIATKYTQGTLSEEVRKEMEVDGIREFRSQFPIEIQDMINPDIIIDPFSIATGIYDHLKQLIEFYIQKDIGYLLIKNLDEELQITDIGAIKKGLIEEKYQYLFIFSYIDNYLFSKKYTTLKPYLMKHYDKNLVRKLYKETAKSIIEKSINEILTITDKVFQKKDDETTVVLVLNGIIIKTAIELGDCLIDCYYQYIGNSDLKNHQLAVNYIKTILQESMEEEKIKQKGNSYMKKPL